MTTEEKTIDIVRLIEDNPITRFSASANTKVVEKCRKMFNTEEQHLFLGSFYCYLNQNNSDFVVELSNIWKWVGFSRIDHAKTLITKEFIENKDYIILFLNSREKETPVIGRPTENILLTIRCFKKLCLKARTKKADEIHDYYIKLEEIMHEIIEEESEELKNQLLVKDQEIIDTREKTMISAYHLKPLVYLAIVEENIVKFGYSNDIKTRYNTHKKEIGSQFKLEYVIETIHNRELEQMIKSNFKENRVEKEYLSKNQTELLTLDKTLTIDKLYKTVVLFSESFDNGEIIIKLSDENETLKNENNMLKKNIQLENDGIYIYLISTDKVNKYILDITDDYAFVEKSVKYYKTINAKKIKQLAYILLDACRFNENIFDVTYEIIQDVLDYCVITYDKYKIHKNDIYRFSYLQKYVNRFPKDKLLIKKSEELIKIDIYNEYISERIEYGPNYKVAIIMIHDDIKKWCSSKYPLLNIDSIQDYYLKEDINRNFEKITKIEKTNVCTYDKIKNIKISSYPGFVGFRIKEESSIIYEENIYKDFFEKTVKYTGNTKDRIFRTILLDTFVIFVENNYKLNKDTKGKMRYKLNFSNEFVSMIKKYLKIDYNAELRCNKGKSNFHGGFIGLKMIR
jgi:phage anti-repressor protein/predicted GIY-YIG superfamily endonuclease